MTFDLWPDFQGHVKRNLRSVSFQRLKLANFGIFAGDMDVDRCCEVTSIVNTDIVTFSRSTEVIRGQWPLMTSYVIHFSGLCNFGNFYFWILTPKMVRRGPKASHSILKTAAVRNVLVFNPRPAGVWLVTRPAGGGGGGHNRQRAPEISQTTGPISKFQTPFDIPVRTRQNNFTWRSLMTSQVRSK